LTTSECIEESE